MVVRWGHADFAPSEDMQKAIRGLVFSLGELYPCEACRQALGPELESLPPVPTHSREAVVMWFCDLHNLVNHDVVRPHAGTLSCHLLLRCYCIALSPASKTGLL